MAHSLVASGRRTARDLPPVEPQDLGTLSRACGIPLAAYRPDHVAERVARTVEREGVGGPAELAALLRRSPEACERFRRAVAISVTAWFRDPEQFELMRRRILPDLLGTPGDVRVWCAGCANGLEVYGVATLLEEQGALGRSYLLGSDLLESNIATARAGGAADAPRPGTAVVARTRWEVRDLTAGIAPEGRFRLILCRNVGIYFAPDARDALIDLLAGALAARGVLLLGRSERLLDPARHGLESYDDHAYRRAA